MVPIKRREHAVRNIWSIAVAGLVAAVLLPLALVAQEPKPKAAESSPAKEKPAASAAGTYKVDPVHSSNVFCIRHLNVANFYGRFDEAAGTFVLNDDATKDAFDVTIKVASIDTHNDGRDKHLKSDAFFDVEKYPDITFKSTAVKKEGASALAVTGDLTLHGTTKPITTTVTLIGSGPGMKGEFRAGFETTFTIKRSEYGVSALPGALGEDVKITVSVEGIRE
jgi:polyisoprenoid-binding protein YceI